MLLEQLTFHWENQARPGLDGLTDGEYLWEPVPDMWSLRPRGEARTPQAAGGGDWVADFAYPEPDPAPVTTIAWRLAHVIVGVFGMRNASHFGGPAMDYATFEYSPTAAGALAALDGVYKRWTEGVRGLDEDGLARPVGPAGRPGPAEGPYAEYPYATLVLHIHREARSTTSPRCCCSVTSTDERTSDERRHHRAGHL